MSLTWQGTTLTELERAVREAEIKASIERQEAQAPEDLGGYPDPADDPRFA